MSLLFITAGRGFLTVIFFVLLMLSLVFMSILLAWFYRTHQRRLMLIRELDGVTISSQLQERRLLFILYLLSTLILSVVLFSIYISALSNLLPA